MLVTGSVVECQFNMRLFCQRTVGTKPINWLWGQFHSDCFVMGTGPLLATRSVAMGQYNMELFHRVTSAWYWTSCHGYLLTCDCLVMGQLGIRSIATGRFKWNCFVTGLLDTESTHTPSIFLSTKLVQF
jgi:hypothetical protein